MNDETIKDNDKLSVCCGAPLYTETDICSDCKEHSGVDDEDKEKINDAIDTEDFGAKADYEWQKEKDNK